MAINLLLAFISAVTILLVVTAVWQIAVRVPFIPTPRHITDTMLGMIPWKGNETVLDLGAGDGRILEMVKLKHPHVTAIGYEIVPTVWLLGWLRQAIRQSHVTLKWKSMFRADLSKADVIVLYLFPELMKDLREKFDRELKPGTLVVCHTFGFKDLVPLKTLRVPRLGSEVSVFLYSWPINSIQKSDK